MEKTKNKDLPIGRDTENVLKEWLKMYKDLPINKITQISKIIQLGKMLLKLTN